MDRKAYFEAATKLLSKSGAKGLSVASLCRAVGLTTGSFYHHFRDWQDFLSEYLKDWERQQVNRIIDVVLTYEAPAERLEVLFKLAVEVPHAAEAAIRAWAVTDERVAAAQQRIDRQRLEFTVELVGSLVSDPARSRTFAELIVAAFVGIELLNRDGAGPQMGSALEELRRAILQAARLVDAGSHAERVDIE